MNVAEIMTRNPVTINHTATLGEALALMERVGCRHLPVISGDGHLIGIVSDRDCRLALNSPHIMRERWQDDDIAEHTIIASIMTPAPIITEGDVPVHEATRLMLTHHISALPVMRGETLVGIITTSDLLVAFMSLHRRMAQAAPVSEI
jgi:acetoin utilization protein AcuB